MQFTQYFLAMRSRPDRALIRLEWIERVVRHPAKEMVQRDGRVRRWGPVPEAGGKFLRVVLLPGRQTVHFDGSFET
jgi:hypothetical protein